MMMSALQAGGMPLVVDEIRQADDNNPKGYYEFERVKKLPKGDTVWLAELRARPLRSFPHCWNTYRKNMLIASFLWSATWGRSWHPNSG